MMGNDKTNIPYKKYDASYFGIATGIIFVIIFLLAIFKMSISTIDSISVIKIFIPFFNDISLINVLGGILLSFFLGWILGYLFMAIYNLIDKLFQKKIGVKNGT